MIGYEILSSYLRDIKLILFERKVSLRGERVFADLASSYWFQKTHADAIASVAGPDSTVDDSVPDSNDVGLVAISLESGS